MEFPTTILYKYMIVYSTRLEDNRTAWVLSKKKDLNVCDDDKRNSSQHSSRDIHMIN